MELSCFNNIIGFSRGSCPCFEFAAGSNTSVSGLYMDELPESEHILKGIKNIADCGKTLTTIFENARRNAVAEYVTRLLKEIGTRFKAKQDPYNGLIGQNNFTAAASLSTDFMGVVYQMNYLSGGEMKIKKIHVSINATIPGLIIEVWKAYVINSKYELQQKITDVTIDTVANTTAVKDLSSAPITLPLADDSNHIINYLLLIDRSTGFQPMNNSIGCGCQKQTLLEKWLVQGSIAGNDKNNLLPTLRATTQTKPINGIVSEVEISCTDVSFICENYNRNPFIKTAMEHAVLYEAVSGLLKNLLSSDDVSRFALTKREQMKTDSIILHNKFKGNVAWIAENMDLTNNNCFICNTINDTQAPYKAGIRF